MNRHRQSGQGGSPREGCPQRNGGREESARGRKPCRDLRAVLLTGSGARSGLGVSSRLQSSPLGGRCQAFLLALDLRQVANLLWALQGNGNNGCLPKS